jgi:hypothetical protein
MANESKTISADTLLEKREEQLKVINSIVEDVNKLQEALNNRQQQLNINQGAILQLNILLEELGIELPTETVGGEEVAEEVVEDETELVPASDVTVEFPSEKVEEVEEL